MSSFRNRCLAVRVTKKPLASNLRMDDYRVAVALTARERFLPNRSIEGIIGCGLFWPGGGWDWRMC